MPPHGRYTLDDFVKTGQADFKKQFRAITKPELFRFEKRTYVDKSEQVCEDTLLYMGKWHSSVTRVDGPTVWALSTKEGIRYYAGPHGRILLPVVQPGRIYHENPFDLLFKSEEVDASQRGYDRTLEVKEAVIEPVINFAFLLTGRIKHLDNTTGADVLSNFHFACMTLHKNTGKSKDARSSLLELPQPDVVSMVLPDRRRDRIKREDQAQSQTSTSTTLFSRKRSRSDRDDEEHDSLVPLHKKQRTFINQLTKYETTIRAEMADEVQALEFQLEQQKTKTITARQKRHCDKDARQAAEDELRELKARISEHEQTIEEMVKGEMASKDEVRRLKAQAAAHKDTVNQMREKRIDGEKEVTHWKALYELSIKGEDSKCARKKKAKPAMRAFEAEMKTKIKQEE